MSQKPVTCVVIMNTFNSARYVAEAIASIQAQTFRDIRLFVLDGGSEDPTLEIAQAFERRDPRIVVRSMPGVSREDRYDALDAELNLESYCEFIAKQASDDVSYRDRIERQVAVFREHPEVDMCSGSYRSFWHNRDSIPPMDGYFVHEKPETHEEIRAELIFWWVMHDPSIMYRTTSLTAPVPPVGTPRPSDPMTFKYIGDWWASVVRINQIGYYNVKQELSAYRLHYKSDGASNVPLVRAEEKVLRERALRHFGFDATDDDVKTHCKIRVLPDNELEVTTPQECLDVIAWLRKLKAQNDEREIFDRAIFDRVLNLVYGRSVALMQAKGFVRSS